jgi:hypothetical protein
MELYFLLTLVRPFIRHYTILIWSMAPTYRQLERKRWYSHGMMSMGGNNGYGGIPYDPNSLNYTKVADFDGSNGYRPSGGLIQANDGKLYGMTWEAVILPRQELFFHSTLLQQRTQYCTVLSIQTVAAHMVLSCRPVMESYMV